jgi:hypothetical protein
VLTFYRKQCRLSNGSVESSVGVDLCEGFSIETPCRRGARKLLRRWLIAEGYTGKFKRGLKKPIRTATVVSR